MLMNVSYLNQRHFRSKSFCIFVEVNVIWCKSFDWDEDICGSYGYMNSNTLFFIMKLGMGTEKCEHPHSKFYIKK
jgi:hypothetical protein